MACITPPHLSSSQFELLKSRECDTTATKKAKRFIRSQDCRVTPLSTRDTNIDTIARGQTKRSLAFFTPSKGTNAIYRWKVEGDKRLIGKAAFVRKRLNGYFSALRKGETKLAKLVLTSLKKSCKQSGISFGIIHNNVPEELLGKVENLVIKIQKLAHTDTLLNQRAGGGGASKRKPLTEKDRALITKVISKISLEKLKKPEPLTKPSFSTKFRRGVVYNIINTKTNRHYVGKTERLFSSRLSEHMSAVKTTKRAKELHRDIRRSPQDFYVRILYQAPPSKPHILEAIESAYIQALSAYESGYNKTTGAIRL